MLNDLKAAWRTLCRSPGYTAVAVITLALAIGANTAIFSFADAVLFRPLPYHEADRVYILQMLDRSTGQQYVMTPFEYLKAIDEHHRGLGPVGMADSGQTIVVSTNDGAEGIRAWGVTPDFFQILGIRPIRGRVLDGRDAEQPGSGAMLSYGTWQRWFGGDEQVVGRSVTLGTATYDVVGILPNELIFPSGLARNVDLVTVVAPPRPGTEGGTFHPIVRLEPGVTREQAQAEIEAIVAPIAVRRSEPDNTPVLLDVRSALYPAGQSIMKFLLAAAALVLLIGCANLANMLLVLTRRRDREIAVRTALGASPARLVRPIVFESILTGLAGAVLAVAVTAVAFEALKHQVPPVAYGSAPVGMKFRVLIFALGLGLLSSLLFSVFPAWRAARTDVQSLIQQRRDWNGNRRGHLGRPLVAVQVALSVLLVFGAAIVSRELVRVLTVPLGFDPENVLTLQVQPPSGLETDLDRQAFYSLAMETLRGWSGVSSVGAAGVLPVSGQGPDESGWISESAFKETGIRTGICHVMPGYFETAGIRLIRGRLLDWSDVSSNTKVAVVSESAARSLFRGRDPVGSMFESESGRQFTVVGVVTDVGDLTPGHQPRLSYIISDGSTHQLTLIARMRSRQETMLSEIRREIGTLAPNRIVNVGWWEDSINTRTEFRLPGFQTLVLNSFGTLALGLTALGIFSIVAFLIASRTREIGVRLAVGATPESLVLWVSRQALAPVAVGLVVGLAATQWLRPLAEAQFYEINADDPTALALAGITVIATALLAAYLPARRASRVDPMAVLREE